MVDLTSSAGVAAAAITLANIIVWAFGEGWTPRQKAGIGALCAFVVFVFGVMMFPANYQEPGAAMLLLLEAILVVLAAAGAPVYRDVLRAGRAASDDAAMVGKAGAPGTPNEKPGRTWTAWNR